MRRARQVHIRRLRAQLGRFVRSIEIRRDAITVGGVTGVSVVPWEVRGLSALRRWLATFKVALQPVSSIDAMRGENVRAAVAFAAFSFAPLALLSGVIPFTKTLQFGPLMHVEVTGQHGTAEIAFDVLRAVAVGFGIELVSFLALALPFTSLVNAYAPAAPPSDMRHIPRQSVPPGFLSLPPGTVPAVRNPRAVAWRTMLYRGWLLAVRRPLLSLALWLAPLSVTQEVLLVLQLAGIIPLVMLLNSMHAVSRRLCGLSVGAVLAATFVPIGLLVATDLMQALALQHYFHIDPAALSP